MSLNSSAVQPPITTQQQDTNLHAVFVPGAAAAVNQSKPEHIEPVLLNPAKNNSSVQVVDELNRPSTPIVEHSAPEKSPRSTNAILAALPNTTDDSLENLKQAALSGDKKAQFNLGEMYDKGEGVEVDKVKAFEWFQKAAAQGHPGAQFNVAIMYDKGEGVGQNKKKAFEWFHKAAVQGDLDAQFTVGMMYDEGEGVEQNEEKAFEWYQMAAGQGHPDAQFNLALMYDFGEGVEENEEKAFEWLSKAADQGHAKAQLSLSRCYGEGSCTRCAAIDGAYR
jgi:TPR repeat protein